MKPIQTFHRTILLSGLVTLVLAGPGSTRAELAGEDRIDDFERTRDFIVAVDGEEIDHAEVYVSRSAFATLIFVDDLAFLIDPRGRSWSSVDREKAPRGASRDVVFLEAGAARFAGTYTDRLGGRSFEAAGHEIEIRQRPPLLGRGSSRQVESRHPEFRRQANRLTSKSAPRAHFGLPEEPVRVRVYFASWSPICDRVMPKILRLERSLSNRVSFEYYGLPKPLDSDPLVRELGISGVPTMVVEVGGEEIGRVTGRELDSPDQALTRLMKAR